MGEISQKDSSVLYARLEELKSEMSNLENEKNQSIAIEVEQLRIQKKINVEIIEKQNEALRIQLALNNNNDRSSFDIEEVKNLLNENGLQVTASEILDSMATRSSCSTPCTKCVLCTTKCTSGCTTCTTCVSEQLVGSLT
ncbi:MAG: hypothetical protein WBL93_14610 [Lutisporaceae bacterium]